MTDDTTTEEETADTVEHAEPLAEQSAPESEAAGSAAPVGAGLANEWTGGNAAGPDEGEAPGMEHRGWKSRTSPV